MKALLRKAKLSLHGRLMLGMAVMLLPLIILGLVSSVSIRSVVKALTVVVQTEIRELEPVSDLEKLLLKAAMPPNDYIIHGSADERTNFALLGKEIDGTYQNFLSSPDLAEERELISASWEEWEKARFEGRRILATPNPMSNRALEQRMEIFDAHIDRATEILDQAHELIHEDISKHLAHAQVVERRITVLVAIVFLLGIATALAAGWLLSRSITVPLKALEDGIFRFSQGDHSFRVVLDRKDELGQLAKTMNVMAERLEYDSLTGVFNRHEFHRKLKIEAERSFRYGHTFSLLMVDIDHFKNVNDTYGHQAGDEALRAVAVIAGRALRSADILARYGGEEFAIILPETPSEGALRVAERLRDQVEDSPIMIPSGKVLNLTVSIGVAIFPADAKSEDDIIAAADQAMYAAKQAGRNRVVRYAASAAEGQGQA